MHPPLDLTPSFFLRLFLMLRCGTPAAASKGTTSRPPSPRATPTGGCWPGLARTRSGVAGSLFRDQDKLKESICRAYPQLRKSSDEFEFGYRMAFEGLSEDKEQMVVIEPKESKGIFDNIKNAFAGN
jgi:Family of unknown function (DUF6523)